MLPYKKYKYCKSQFKFKKKYKTLKNVQLRIKDLKRRQQIKTQSILVPQFERLIY